MEVLERNSDNDATGPIFDCADSYLDLSNMFFGVGGVHNEILHQIIYSLVKLHVH